MIKKIFSLLVSIFVIFTFALPVLAQQNSVRLYVFWSESCPHCIEEVSFLNRIEPEYPNLQIVGFEVGRSVENSQLLKDVGEKLNIDVGGVPITFIGEDYSVGYLDDSTTGKKITDLIEKYQREGDPDIVGKILDSLGKEIVIEETDDQDAEDSQEKVSEVEIREDADATPPSVNIPDQVKIPFFGFIDTKNLSLPALTFVVALVDGFNPCAMWVLLFLISMLLGMKDRSKMWILGTTFILVSGLVYFLFLSAWLSLFQFIGFVIWVRIVIGIFALFMGVYQLRDYWVNRGACKIVDNDKRKKVFERIKNATQNKTFVVALFGIIILAFLVNLVELVCSAGLPAIYTQVLSLSELARWQYYLYLSFYVLVFMIDDMLVFIIAMTTLRVVGIESKYARYSRLIGGIIIFIIGILMLFKPNILMFS